MAEKEPNEQDRSSEEDVSMDEILTSLRSILEEEDSDSTPAKGREGAESPAQTEAPEGEAFGEEAGEAESGDEEELVLTDVVDEGPAASGAYSEEEKEEEPPPLTDTFTEGMGTEEQASTNEELDALIGELEEEASPSPEPETSPVAEEEEGPLTFDLDEGGPAEPMTPPAGGEEEEAAGSALDEGSPAGMGPATEPAPEEASPTAEPAPESPAPALDSESIQQAVEATVQEQVDQVTADLDNRLAEILEPKIRETLEGYLSERLPALLRELAEAEIERIKRGE